MSCLEGVLALHEGTIVDLPLDDACLDGLIAVNTIYFVGDLDRGFRVRSVDEVAGLLRDAGLTAVRHERVGAGERAFHLLVASHAASAKPSIG